MKTVPEELWAMWADGIGGTFRAGRIVQAVPPTVEPVDEFLALDGYEENPFFVAVDQSKIEVRLAAAYPEKFAKFYAQPALSQKLLPAPAPVPEAEPWFKLWRETDLHAPSAAAMESLRDGSPELPDE